MKTVWITLFITITTIVSGCTPGSDSQLDIEVISLERPDSENLDGEEIRFIPAVEFHDSLFIEVIPSIDIDRHGNLYVAAERHRIRSVYQYSPEGELLDTLGLFGNKPGEFESIREIQIIGDSLFVFDDVLHRATQFDVTENRLLAVSEYERVEVHVDDETVEFHPVPLRRWGSGRYLMELQDRRNPAIFTNSFQFYRLADSEGGIEDADLFELQSERMLIGDLAGRPSAFQLPYPERSLLTRSNSGVFYTAWTEEFEITERDSTGSVRKVFTFPYDRAPLDAEGMIREQYSHNRQLQLTRQSAVYPNEWPAIYTMFTDDRNNLWVALIPEDESKFEWWIIDPSNEQGTVLQIFDWPRSSIFRMAVNGRVYAVESDDDGFKKVNSYSYR